MTRNIPSVPEYEHMDAPMRWMPHWPADYRPVEENGRHSAWCPGCAISVVARKRRTGLTGIHSERHAEELDDA